jgi:hypothetical protein
VRKKILKKRLKNCAENKFFVAEKRISLKIVICGFLLEQQKAFKWNIKYSNIE